MKNLIEIKSVEDILPEYRNTPIGDLLEYHNLNKTFSDYSTAKLLIGMCIDNRKNLLLPDNFAFVIRAGGANLNRSEFKLSYAIAVGGVQYIALIGHNHCGMINLASRKEQFVNGLVQAAGWTQQQAEDHFMQFAPIFEVGKKEDDEEKFILSETKRLRKLYPKIKIAPMLYLVEDNKLYLIKENE